MESPHTSAIDFAKLTSRLARDSGGVWRPASESGRVAPLSFPDDGHDACFRIEDASFWFAHRNACIAASLEPFRAQLDGPVLDVGGGNGSVSQALEQHGFSAVLLEPGEAGAANARRRGLENVVCATLEGAGFADGSFGAAGAFDVIEHIADDAAVVREVHRVLRPGGVFCVTVPAYGWLWSGEDEVAGHHRRYTLADLEALLERCSFDVRFKTYFFAALTLPVFLFRSLRHRLGKRDNAAIDEGAAAQHVPSPVAARAIDLLLAPERAQIRAGRSIPFGTSCLAVAVKR